MRPTNLLPKMMIERAEQDKCTDSSCTSQTTTTHTERRSSNSSARKPTAIGCRRKLKSSLFFAFTILAYYSIIATTPATHAFSTVRNQAGLSQRRNEWIERSVQYYSTVMRTKSSGGSFSTTSTTPSSSEVALLTNDDSEYEYEYDKDFVVLATKHYYSRLLIKMGKFELAEKLYRRIIYQLTSEEEEDQCDHTKLAVSTLLLALHMQRTDDIKATRAVFLDFFRRVATSSGQNENEEINQCSCSAKVLQAYALFEMKNGHSAKSLEIIKLAVKMDEKLTPVLGWKQFQDAAAGREYVPTFSFRRGSKCGRNHSKQVAEGGGLSP